MSLGNESGAAPFDWEHMPPVSEPVSATPTPAADEVAEFLERRAEPMTHGELEPYPDPIEPETEPGDGAERLALFGIGAALGYIGLQLLDVPPAGYDSQFLEAVCEITIDVVGLLGMSLGAATMAVSIVGKRSDAETHDELPSTKDNG